jgi:hypothetical protein
VIDACIAPHVTFCVKSLDQIEDVLRSVRAADVNSEMLQHLRGINAELNWLLGSLRDASSLFIVTWPEIRFTMPTAPGSESPVWEDVLNPLANVFPRL